MCRGEDQGLKQGMGALGFGGVGGEDALRGGAGSHRMWAWTRPPACHPRFPHGEGRKLPIPGPLAGGREQGVGSGPHIFPPVLQAFQWAWP